MNDTTRAAKAALCFSGTPDKRTESTEFGEFSPADAVGIMLAHSLRVALKTGDELRLRKGHRLTLDDVTLLQEAGIRHVIGAHLAPDSVEENTAAERIAQHLAGTHTVTRPPHAGRGNLHADCTGILVIDAPRVIEANRLDESIAIGTLPPWSLVRTGQVIATVKIIPCGVPHALLEACCAKLTPAPLHIAKLQPRRAALIVTELPGLREKSLASTIAVTRQRLESLGSRLALELRCHHSTTAIKSALHQARAAGCDLILISGAAGTKDRRDLVPQAIIATGGQIERFGTPVEPGNMLLLARLNHCPVLVLPGCARSRRLNGLDWVLQRLLANLPLGPDEFAAMGIGGLIRHSPGIYPEPASDTDEPDNEPVRPAPRPTPPPAPTSPHVAILVMAAGRSQRMGRQKLLEPFEGIPLIQRAVQAACAARAPTVQVVLGSHADEMWPIIDATRATYTLNPDYAHGMASSLCHGVATLPQEVDAVLIMLADMPHINAQHLDQMIGFYEQHAQTAPIIVPVHAGRRGNPVLWPRRLFQKIMQLNGDQGARHLLEHHADEVLSLDVDDPTIFLDIDTPQDLLDHAEKN